jgi:hypothetical protein
MTMNISIFRNTVKRVGTAIKILATIVLLVITYNTVLKFTITSFGIGEVPIDGGASAMLEDYSSTEKLKAKCL